MKLLSGGIIFFLSLIFLVVGIWYGSSDKLYYFSRAQKLDVSHLTDRYDNSYSQAIFNNQKIAIPASLKQEGVSPHVLGANQAPKRIEIDLSHQRLYAYEGNSLVYNFLISSGKWQKTPTGNFRIWIKLRYTRMQGGSRALNTYYDVPNVPHTMYFASTEIPAWQGYAIHGAYWHNNFGHPMSHGCVNLKLEDAALLYYWALPDLKEKSSIQASVNNPGTEIVIYGTTPAN